MLSASSTELATTERIARLYGLEIESQLAVEKGYRNESHPLRLRGGSLANVIIYKNESDMARTIQNANRVANFLANRGLPVRCTLDDRLARLRSARGARYAAIYNYLPGRTIAWEAYTQKHLKLLGASLSDMHAALADFDARALPTVADVYLEIFTRMQRYFAEPGVQIALRQKLNLNPPNLEPHFAILKACRHLPGQQALHMDFVRGNILFSEANGELGVSGILDFEKTACGHRLFDIARTLAFLLVDCKYKQPDKVRKYFLQSGYHRRGVADYHNVRIKTTDGEMNVLENLIDTFLLHDFYKFLRHNPYESLPHNEHFIRTRALLLDRKVLERASLR